MWLSFLLVFGLLVVAGALLIGWGAPFLLLFFLLFAGLAVFFVVHRGRRETTDDRDQASEPSPGRAAEPLPPELAPQPGAMKPPDPDHAT
jgi:membrane protein implicated in regulation of membrane protease activity